MPDKKVKKTSEDRRTLLRGIEAFAHGARSAGCRYFFGARVEKFKAFYDVLAEVLPRDGGKFVFAESEESAIHMVFGAAAGGGSVLTAVDSPGFSRIQEGLSFLAAAELPAVVLDCVRAGPGVGNLSPGQGDYEAAVKGGGHGDYQCLVLAPHSVPDFLDHGRWAFELSSKYRTPVIVLADGAIAQMMEPVPCDEKKRVRSPSPDWAAKGCLNRSRNEISTLEMNETDLEIRVFQLHERYRRIQEDFASKELLHRSYLAFDTDDCEVLVVAYGFLGRVARTALEKARKRGLKVGVFIPRVLWPFPVQAFKDIASRASQVLVCEMSMGQMANDIRRHVPDPAAVRLYSRVGGRLPSPFELLNTIKSVFEHR